MHFLNEAMKALTGYKMLLSALRDNRTPAVTSGLSGIHKANLISAMLSDTGEKALVIAGDEAEGSEMVNNLTAFGLRAYFYPARDFTLRDMAGISHEYEQERIKVLSHMLSGKYDAIVCCPDAAMQYTIPPGDLKRRTFTLRAGENISPEEVTAKLLAAGYTRSDQVEGVGQFSRRGGIVDFFPPDSHDPVRVEFWGDAIDSMSYFDAITQRRTDALKRISLPPVVEVLCGDINNLIEKMEQLAQKVRAKHGAAAEKLLSDADVLRGGVHLTSPDRYLPLCYSHPGTLFDFLEGGLLYVSETGKVSERMRAFEWQMSEDITGLLAEGILCPGLDRYTLQKSEMEEIFSTLQTFYLETFLRGHLPTKAYQSVGFTVSQASPWDGWTDALLEDIVPALEKDFACVIFAATERAGKTLAADLAAQNIPAQYIARPASLKPSLVIVTTGGISAGFSYSEAGVLVITQGTALKRTSRKPRKNKNAKPIESALELQKGDYVVHVSHGIGLFDGIHKMQVEGVIKDYIKIKYAKQDTLYVPVTQLDLVSRYIGPQEEGLIKLNRLGGTEWQKTKSRVAAAVKDMAKQLIKLYAERMHKPGHAFRPDTEIQYDFERRFEYEETDDQLKCAREIKADMEKPYPMERLLCGDVGFGKTEVALRAAFKCVTEGKQCALLVPTTILAWQHYGTVTRRMHGIPVNVEMLSRFRTPKEQADIIKRLRTGELDMVIGTHRLISKDVQFKNLGLCIIDEEQRFGVAQKEKFKEMFPAVDILTLSATPIPRTLNMSMTGLRDMSIIEEAPQDRQPVQTYVLEYDRGIQYEAIHRELRRGGQIYYLHNRVESIERVAARLAADFPNASVGVAHGKMSEDELSEVWQRLIENQINLLVCTTIIETGVDVSNVNTLIIEDADRMGLAQLHQLRGRVGRSPRRAYAYLTFRSGKVINEVAVKRLEAIREFTEFGSGFKIAMRDLEIRGAGNILGAQQHGHMESVGYDMYLKLLNQAVDEEKGIDKPAFDEECLIDLQISAHIPEDYIPAPEQRLFIYRRIADIQSKEDASDVLDELIDRFGNPPEAVNGLIDIALLRRRLTDAGIAEVSQKGDSILLYPRKLDMDLWGRLMVSMKGRVLVNAGNKPYVAVKRRGQSLMDTLITTADIITQIHA